MAQSSVHAAASLAQLSVLGRLAVSAFGLSFYLWKMVVPVNLSPLYELPPTVNLVAMPLILSYGVVLAITAIILALRRRVPGLPAVWLAYVVVLLPVLGIVQSGPQIAADRYTYLAGLGWAILAGAGLLFYSQSLGRSKTGTLTTPPIAGVAICVVVGLGVLTWNQVQGWHDPEKLWTRVLARDPESYLAQNHIGVLLAEQSKLAEASEHYRKALQIRPNYADPHINWGNALVREGKLAEAIDHYQQALHFKPDYADAHTNWGLALVQQGKPAEAIDHYQQALQIKPDHAVAHYNWGNALIQQGKPAEAGDHYRQALHFKPGYAIAHTNWGVALAQQGKPAEAGGPYRPGLRSKPGSTEALSLSG